MTISDRRFSKYLLSGQQFAAQSIQTIKQDYYSSIKNKQTIEGNFIYNKAPKLTSVPPEMKMDFSRILNKPFFIQNVSWPSSAVRGTNIINLALPTGLLRNALIKIPFQSAALFRMKGCILLQVAGTPMHQGICVASIVPNSVPYTNLTQMIQPPHAFLNANECTPVCIEMPFYARSQLVSTQVNATVASLNDFDYAALIIQVVNPIAAGASATLPVTISVQVVITDLEMYVPKNDSITWLTACGRQSMVSVSCTCSENNCVIHDSRVNPEEFSTHSFTDRMLKIPTQIFDGLAKGAKIVTGDFIDSIRVGIRELTGFHNPNSPAVNDRVIHGTRNFINAVDQPTLYEKLDQHAQFDRITRDYIFDTDRDEMDLLTILSKPMSESWFKVGTTDISGKLLYSRPITPYVETSSVSYYSPLRKFYEASRYWRGGLKVHIQSSMTNFHYCKLLIVRNYAPTVNIFSSYPTMTDVTNLMTETLEFSAGGQIQTIDMPFCSQLEQLECTKSLTANAAMHGMFYIYLLQPLTANGSVPLTVDFNVYISVADDFQFYGYATDLSTVSIPAAFSSLAKLEESDRKRYSNPTVAKPEVSQRYSTHTLVVSHAKSKREIETEPFVEEFVTSTSKIEAETEPLVEEFVTHSGVATTVDVSEQEQLLETSQTNTRDLRMDDFKPMINIRDYIRRPVCTQSDSFVSNVDNAGILIVPVAQLLRNATRIPAFKSIVGNYLGFNGGLKIKALIFGDSLCMINYLPPSVVNAGNVMLPAIPNPTTTSNYTPFFAYGGGYFNASTPVIEITQHTIDSQSEHTYEMEFVIPNMNPFRFVRHNPAIISDKLDTDLGNIIISFDASSLTAHCLVTWYVGFTDETRFGYQVLAPVTSVPTVLTGSIVSRLTPYNVPVTPYVNDTSTIPTKWCYFTKQT